MKLKRILLPILAWSELMLTSYHSILCNKYNLYTPPTNKSAKRLYVKKAFGFVFIIY